MPNGSNHHDDHYQKLCRKTTSAVLALEAGLFPESNGSQNMTPSPRPAFGDQNLVTLNSSYDYRVGRDKDELEEGRKYKLVSGSVGDIALFGEDTPIV